MNMADKSLQGDESSGLAIIGSSYLPRASLLGVHVPPPDGSGTAIFDHSRHSYFSGASSAGKTYADGCGARSLCLGKTTSDPALPEGRALQMVMSVGSQSALRRRNEISDPDCRDYGATQGTSTVRPATPESERRSTASSHACQGHERAALLAP